MTVELSDPEMMRYNRQIVLRGFDFEGQEALKAASVLVVGLGGLGCAAAQYLAAAGVGSMTLVFSIALFVLLLCFLLIRLQRYFLAQYYLLDQETSVRKAVRASIHASKGICDEIFAFKLSFLPWGIASILVLPLLYVSPYYSMSSLLYARFLMEQDKRANSLVVASSPEETPEDYPEDIATTRQFDPQHEERLEDE